MTDPPTFEFTEVLSEGRIDHKIYYDCECFLPYGDYVPANFAFFVEKNLATMQLNIIVRSPFLHRKIEPIGSFIELSGIPRLYDHIKYALGLSEPTNSEVLPEQVQELRLLADCLLDRSIFNGFSLPHLLGQKFISQDHWQDMQCRSTQTDLDTVDNAFKTHCEHLNSSGDTIDGELREFEQDDSWISLLSSGSDLDSLMSIDFNQPPISPLRMPSCSALLWSGCRKEVPTVGETWMEPANVDDCLVWDPDKACGISQEQKVLHHVVRDEIRNLVQEWLQINDLSGPSSHRPTRIVLFGIADSDLNARNLSIDPRFRAIRRLSLKEKHEFVTQRLHEASREEIFNYARKNFGYDLRYYAGPTPIPTPFSGVATLGTKYAKPRANPSMLPVYYSGHRSRCVPPYMDYRKAWNEGVNTIRRFMKGKRPKTLDEVRCLLQVAHAMGSQDPSNPDFHTSFVNDLDRWKMIIPQKSQPEFDRLVQNTWREMSEKPEAASPPEYGHDETLYNLQQLLSSLIENCPVMKASKEAEEGNPPSRMEQNRDIAPIDTSLEKVQQRPAGVVDPRTYSDVRRLPVPWKLTDSRTVLLMVGAIFGFIISFLLIIKSLKFPDLILEVAERRHFPFSDFEDRNLHSALLYMGLSTLSRWSNKQATYTIETHTGFIASTVQGGDEWTQSGFMESPSLASCPMGPVAAPIHSPHSINQRRRRVCHKTYSSVSNLNKHFSSIHNVKAQFKCRNQGCTKTDKRSDNLDRHEKYHCSFRLISSS
ncbi:hypothetical protein GGR52DRAFT_375342 [Hypoxylon sp. FL1284]|nr:hypothetical protein GGR52DRAFT_375342 [Hypoxylon sp. FL1284]